MVKTFGEFKNANIAGGKPGRYAVLYDHWVQEDSTIAVDAHHPTVAKSYAQGGPRRGDSLSCSPSAARYSARASPLQQVSCPTCVTASHSSQQ